jgi:hypothetical protein
MTQPDHSFQPVQKRFDLFMLALGPVAIALLALWLGQSTAWDLRNYHWYNPYALLTGRMGFDAAVAHHATFYNPLIDLPLWVVGNVAPGWVAAVFLGAVQGLNFSFLYLIARDALAPELQLRRGIAAIIAALGVSGGYAVILTGTTYYDNVVSVPVLAALWLIIRDRQILDTGRWSDAQRTAILAGVLAGFAVGLKLPTAPFGLAVLAAIALAPGLHGRRIALVFTCGIAAFVSMMATTGWWFFMLWRETGNPLFPYFNDLIGSTLILDSSYRDTRFLPATFSDAILFPFRAALNWRVSSDWVVNDWRVAFAYVAVPVALIVAWVKFASSAPVVTWKASRILFAFAIAAYVSWIAVFAIYRYITPLEMVSPLLIVAAIGLIPLPGRLRWSAIAVAMIAVVSLTTLYKGSRAQAFADSMIEVGVPDIARPDATLAVMTGVEPMGFVIPFFPADIAFLRVDGYLVGPDNKTEYLIRMTDRIDAHLAAGGDLFTLYSSPEEQRGDRALGQIGLRRMDDCAPVPSNIAPTFRWCRVVRAEPVSESPSP